mgnify:FL=1|tara:strand:+ start:282 stop:494 length:213 start_codon:yes stop_codon:yes gene_type:complete
MSKKKRELSQSSKNYNELRALTKELMRRKPEPDKSEQLFEDDPRAANEKDYGRVRRVPTHIFSRNVIDEF